MHALFSFLVLHIAQLRTTCQALTISVKEIIYVTALQNGWRQWGFLFVTVALPGTLEVVQALLGTSEHFLT